MKARPRRFFLAVLLGTLAAAWMALWPWGRPPDIILVVADTLRADYLGCYGFQGDISPQIDALASESLVFDNGTAAAPWTKPSVASLQIHDDR